jgi:hypothetical protein
MEDPEISTSRYWHRILDKSAKKYIEKRQPLQQAMLGKLDIHL